VMKDLDEVRRLLVGLRCNFIYFKDKWTTEGGLMMPYDSFIVPFRTIKDSDKSRSLTYAVERWLVRFHLNYSPYFI
jgi:hypothetical protein